MRLKLSCAGKPPLISTLPDDAPWSVLLDAGRNLCGGGGAVALAVYSGVPRVKLSPPESTPIAELIKSGSLVEFVLDFASAAAPALGDNKNNSNSNNVVVLDHSDGEATTTSKPPVVATVPPGPRGPPAPWACAACTFINTPAAGVCEVCGGPSPHPVPPPALRLQPVPADNACLFTSLAFSLSDGASLTGGPAVRATLVAHIASKPAVFNEALLGAPPAKYCSVMSRKEVWGGGLEASAAADAFSVGVCVVNVQTGVPSLFGEDRGFPRVLYLIYSGVHYDAVVRKWPDGRHQSLFSPDDEDAKAGAIALAAKAKAEGKYVDLAGFNLRCEACRAALTGEHAAMAHAKDTGHSQFVEYKKDAVVR